MTKSNLSWPLFAAIGALGLGGALLAPACTVTSGSDDDVDVDAGGKGGSSNAGGSNSKGGSAGAATGGSGGSSAGSGGSDGGSGGSTGGSGGSAAQMFACDGETVIPTTCDPDSREPGSCNECMETNCCEQWEACAATDTSSGDFVCGWGGPDGTGEIGCIVACMQEGSSDIDTCVNNCASPECPDDGIITVATSELVGCMMAVDTSCEEACWPTQ